MTEQCGSVTNYAFGIPASMTSLTLDESVQPNLNYHPVGTTRQVTNGACPPRFTGVSLNAERVGTNVSDDTKAHNKLVIAWDGYTNPSGSLKGGNTTGGFEVVLLNLTSAPASHPLKDIIMYNYATVWVNDVQYATSLSDNVLNTTYTSGITDTASGKIDISFSSRITACGTSMTLELSPTYSAQFMKNLAQMDPLNPTSLIVVFKLTEDCKPPITVGDVALTLVDDSAAFIYASHYANIAFDSITNLPAGITTSELNSFLTLTLVTEASSASLSLIMASPPVWVTAKGTIVDDVVITISYGFIPDMYTLTASSRSNSSLPTAGAIRFPLAFVTPVPCGNTVQVIVSAGTTTANPGYAITTKSGASLSATSDPLRCPAEFTDVSVASADIQSNKMIKLSWTGYTNAAGAALSNAFIFRPMQNSAQSPSLIDSVPTDPVAVTNTSGVAVQGVTATVVYIAASNLLVVSLAGPATSVPAAGALAFTPVYKADSLCDALGFSYNVTACSPYVRQAPKSVAAIIFPRPCASVKLTLGSETTSHAAVTSKPNGVYTISVKWSELNTATPITTLFTLVAPDSNPQWLHSDVVATVQALGPAGSPLPGVTIFADVMPSSRSVAVSFNISSLQPAEGTLVLTLSNLLITYMCAATALTPSPRVLTLSAPATLKFNAGSINSVSLPYDRCNATWVCTDNRVPCNVEVETHYATT